MNNKKEKNFKNNEKIEFKKFKISNIKNTEKTKKTSKEINEQESLPSILSFLSTFLISSSVLTTSLIETWFKETKNEKFNGTTTSIFNGPTLPQHDIVLSVNSLNANEQTDVIRPTPSGKLLLDYETYNQPFYLISASSLSRNPDNINLLTGQPQELDIDLSALMSSSQKQVFEINILTHIATELIKRQLGLQEFNDEKLSLYHTFLKDLYGLNNPFNKQSHAIYNINGIQHNTLTPYEALISLFYGYLQLNDEKKLLDETEALLNNKINLDFLFSLLSIAEQAPQTAQDNLISALLSHPLIIHNETSVIIREQNESITQVTKNDFIINGYYINIPPAKTINITLNDGLESQTRTAIKSNNQFSSEPFQLTSFKGENVDVEVYIFENGIKNLLYKNNFENTFYVDIQNIDINASHKKVSFSDKEQFSIQGKNIGLKENEIITLNLSDQYGFKQNYFTAIEDGAFNFTMIDLTAFSFGTIRYSINPVLKSQFVLYSNEFEYAPYQDAAYFFNDFLETEQVDIYEDAFFIAKGHTHGDIDYFTLTIHNNIDIQKQEIYPKQNKWESEPIDLSQFAGDTVYFELKAQDEILPFHPKSQHSFLLNVIEPEPEPDLISPLKGLSPLELKLTQNTLHQLQETTESIDLTRLINQTQINDAQKELNQNSIPFYNETNSHILHKFYNSFEDHQLFTQAIPLQE